MRQAPGLGWVPSSDLSMSSDHNHKLPAPTVPSAGDIRRAFIPLPLSGSFPHLSCSVGPLCCKLLQEVKTCNGNSEPRGQNVLPVKHHLRPLHLPVSVQKPSVERGLGGTGSSPSLLGGPQTQELAHEVRREVLMNQAVSNVKSCPGFEMMPFQVRDI